MFWQISPFRKFMMITAMAVLGLHQTCMLSASAKAAKARGNDPVVKDVVVVHQNSQAFSKSDLYLSENAVRFVARNGDAIIASNAPTWDIVVYSKSKNKGWTKSAAEARKDGLGFLAGGLNTNGGKIVACNEVLFGNKITKIVVLPGPLGHKSRDTFLFQERNTKVTRDTTLKVATPCKIKPAVQDFIRWMYNFNKFAGVPLESKTTYQDGSTVITYFTTSIEHVSKPASYFALPSNYTKVSDTLEVLISDEAGSIMEDLWGDVPKKRQH